MRHVKHQYTEIYTSFQITIDTQPKTCYTYNMNTKERINELRTLALMYEDMERLRSQGWTLQQIADKYKVSRQRVYQIVGKKNGKKAQQ